MCHIFVSLTTDINRVSQNPLVPAVPQKPDSTHYPGVRVDNFFASGCLSITFLQPMATLKEGDQRQMWEFIRV